MSDKLKYIRLTTILALSVWTYCDSFGGNTRSFDTHFRLIPQPQEIQVLAERPLSYNDLPNIYFKKIEVDLFIPGLLNALPRQGTQKSCSVSLTITKAPVLPSDEGYILVVRDKKITIEARSRSGLFYGMQTLNQLIEDARDQKIGIPACRITDFPSIPVRAVHIDVKNHLDSKNYYYQMIDRLASIKINNIIFEFEDKLQYKKAKEVGASDALPIEQFAALSKYAKDRFIEISPLVQGLGHAAFILKHDAYKALRDNPDSDWAFDPLNPATYDLQFSVYEDALAATPYAKYLHVGGDEVGALGKSELSKTSGKTALELQMYWLKKVTDFALEHHVTPIFWDDMVFKLGNLYQTTWDSALSDKSVTDLWAKNRYILDKNIGLFPANCIYMRWNYDTPKLPGNGLALDWYKSHNLNVMPATAAQTFYPMLQRNHSNFQPIKDLCRLTAEKRLGGILCTVWDDSSPHFETIWRGLYDFAWFSWNAEDENQETVHRAFRHRFYSPELEGNDHEFQNLVEDVANAWDTLFVIGVDRENYHEPVQVIDLPDKLKSGQWSLIYKNRLAQAKEADAKSDTAKARIDKALKLTKRNPYNLEVFARMNELLGYSPKLLLLLEKYDQETASGAKTALLKQITTYESQFSGIRTQLEKVFARTRVMNKPAGYKLDSNIRAHWANSSLNTDWMYWYELAMNKKVFQWIQTSAHQ